MIEEQTITLQVGSYANYVGSHLWNLRDPALCNADGACDSARFYRCREGRGRASPCPRALMIDHAEFLETEVAVEVPKAASRDILWGGGVTVHDRRPTTGSRTKNWNDILTAEMHPRCKFGLPMWTSPAAFDSFVAGSTGEVISASDLEVLVDNFRFLAEECDYLTTVHVIADVFDGFGGLGYRLLEEIREDYAGLCIPIWALNSSPAHSRLQDNHIQSSMLSSKSANAALRQSNIPLSYAKLSNVANLISPIHMDYDKVDLSALDPADVGTLSSHSAAIIAAAINTAVSPCFIYDTGTADDLTNLDSPERKAGGHGDQREDGDVYGQVESDKKKACMRSAEWLRAVTRDGNLPFAHLEASLPFPHDSDKAGANTPESLFGISRARGLTHEALNPFMVSLSAAHAGPHAAPMKSIVAPRRERAFSNLLSVRGSPYRGFGSFLYQQCFDSYYMVSSAHIHTQPMQVSQTFPVGVSTAGPRNADARKHVGSQSVVVSVAAAMGSDATMGRHLKSAARPWDAIVGHAVQASEIDFDEDDMEHAEASGARGGGGGLPASTGAAVRVLLDNAKIGQEDREEIQEHLHEVAARYYRGL